MQHVEDSLMINSPPAMAPCINNLRTFLALTLSLVSFKAGAIDLLPNDIEAPPPDMNMVLVSYLSTENAGYYVNNHKPPGNPTISSNSAVFRYVRSYNVGYLPALTYVQTAAGSAMPGGSISTLSSDSGLYDSTLTTAIWPYANRETRTYFGLAGYLIVPTGSYDHNRSINLGENRYRADLQAGYQTQFTEALSGAAAFDTMWFTNNNQYGVNNAKLSQRPVYTSQIGPIYRFNRTFTLGANYLYVVGGDTSINGKSQNLMVQTQRYYLTLLAHFDVGRIAFQYGNDLSVRNGFEETRRFAIRFLKVF